jgi:hypothetical protein
MTNYSGLAWGQLRSKRGFPPEFSWMDWEKPRKHLFRIADAPAIERGISRIEFSATPDNLVITYMSSIGLKLDPFEAASPLRHVSS